MSFAPLGMTFIALLALAGIAHQWGDPSAFPWWRLGAIALVLGFVWEWWQVRRCNLHTSLTAPPLLLGRSSELTLTFKHDERRPLTIEFAPQPPWHCEMASAARTAVLPAQQRPLRHTVALRPVQLGTAPWPPLPLRVKGPFGLGWWRKPQRLDTEVVVVPDTLGGRRTRVGNAPVGAGRRSLAGTGHELDHLRDYQPGDARSAIDWKATARTTSLVTRVVREDQRLSVMLVVDAGRTSRTRIDGLSQLGHYVNVCARFAEHAVANDDQVGLVTVADQPLTRLAPGRGVAAVARIRAALAGLATEAAETDLVAAALAVKQLVRHRCLIVLLTDLYGQSGSGRLMQSIRLWVPKHVPMVAGLIAEDVDHMRRAQAQEWLDPYVSLAAADYRANLEATAAGLHRLGSYPLICRAAMLESRVLEQYRLLKRQRRV